MCQCLVTTSIIDGLALGFWVLWGLIFLVLFLGSVFCVQLNIGLLWEKYHNFSFVLSVDTWGVSSFFSFYEQSLLRIDFKMLP